MLEIISCTHDMLTHFRDHKVPCSRLRHGQTMKDFEAEMRDELSVSGAHTSQSCCLTSPLLFVLLLHHCPDTITPPQTRREADMKGVAHKTWLRDQKQEQVQVHKASVYTEHIEEFCSYQTAFWLSDSRQSYWQTSLPYQKSLCFNLPLTVNAKDGPFVTCVKILVFFYSVVCGSRPLILLSKGNRFSIFNDRLL